MSAGASLKLQANSRHWAAVAGAIAGAFGFAIWANWSSRDISQLSALLLVGMNFLVCAGAGFLAALLLLVRKVPDTEVVSATARAGLRSGLTAALVCAGAILAMSVARAFNAPTRADDMMLRVFTWHTALVLVSALFCSVPAGVAGAIAGLAVRQPHIAQNLIATLFRSTTPTPVRTGGTPPDGTAWVPRVVVGLSVIGILSPLLLLVRDLKVAPAPTAQSPSSTSASFHYEAPHNFEFAEPGQFIIAARKPIPEINPGAPLVLSPDFWLLAYCPAGSGTVVVWNLQACEQVASFGLPATPAHLAWSPDAQRLFYVTQGNDGHMGVLSLATLGVTQLPRPKNRDLPNGPIAWRAPEEIFFYPSDERSLALSLDNLRLSPLADSPALKSADAETAKLWNSAPRLSFPKRDAWRLMLDVCITGIQPPPRRAPGDPWNFSAFSTLAFRDATQQSVQWMPQITVQSGDFLLPVPDGTKLIHHGGRGSEVIYFGLRERPSTVFSCQMPMEAAKAPAAAMVPELIKSHDLCAFVYAPLKNPLNQRTIGPAREQVRGIVRLLKWEGERAEFWMAERLADIRPGDLVSDLHTWEGGQLRMAGELADSNWWATLAEEPVVGRDAIPGNAIAEDLDKGFNMNFSHHDYGLVFQDALRSFHVAKSRRAPAAVGKPSTSPQGVDLFPKPNMEQVPRDRIEKFVVTHHQKAASGNIGALMADYGETVNFMGKYQSHESLKEDEIAYHMKWDRVFESLDGPITILSSGPYFETAYTVAFRTESTSEGRWVSGKSDIRLKLMETNAGFAIREQTAVNHNLQEGALTATKVAPPAPANNADPPPDGTDLPKPRWAGKLGGETGARYQTSHAIHFGPNGAIFHEISRVVEDNGQIRKWCRREVHGQVSRQGNSYFVRFDKQAWTIGSDQVFAQSLSALNYVGQQVQFDISGENLIEHRLERIHIKLSPVP